MASTEAKPVSNSATSPRANTQRKEVVLPDRTVNLIVVHCAATPNGRHFTIEQIDSMHKARGFKRKGPYAGSFNTGLQHVGYHFVITLDGGVYPGRHVNEVGAHVQGKNAHSVGISLIGTDAFTWAQWKALKQTVQSMQSRYPSATVHGHREFANKICPGFDVQEWLRRGKGALAEHIHETPQEAIERLRAEESAQASLADPPQECQIPRERRF